MHVDANSDLDFAHKSNKNEDKVGLTAREKEVLYLMAQGKSNSEIAKELVISEHTAKAHVGHILGKFKVHDRILVVVKAMRAKIIE